MANVVMKKPIQVRASSGVVKDYILSPKNIYSNSLRSIQKQTVLEMVRTDALLAAAVDVIVDLTTFNSYYFEGENDTEKEQAKKIFDDILDFDQELDKIVYAMILFGDPAVELKNITSSTPELHLLEPTTTEPKYDEHGNIVGFIQIPESGAKAREWHPNSIIYMPMKLMDTKVEGYYPLEPLTTVFNTKLFAHHHLQQAFQNSPPKRVWSLENAGDTQKEQFESDLERCKSNPQLDIVAAGKVEGSVVGINFENGFEKVFPIMKEEMLALLRVPPIFLGMPDNSNRSNSEAQLISLESKIRKMHQKIESHFNKPNGLMQRLGFTKTKFKFNKITLRDDKSILEICQILKNIGATGDTIKEYLKSRDFKMPKIFEIQDEVDKKDESSFPSRARGNSQTDKMTNNMQGGASAEGKKKLEKVK